MEPQDRGLSQPPRAAAQDSSTLHSRPPEHVPDIEAEGVSPAPQSSEGCGDEAGASPAVPRGNSARPLYFCQYVHRVSWVHCVERLAPLRVGTSRPFHGHCGSIHGYLAMLALFLFALPGCDDRTTAKAREFCVAIGICARPALPSITVDFVVHARRDSTTNAAIVAEDYANVLTAVTPGSLVRIWKLEERVQDTAIIHAVEIPAFRGRTASQRRAEQMRFIAVERARLSTLVAPLYTRMRATHAPIFEGLARVAMSDGYGRRRLIVLLTDGREISSDLSLDFDSDSPLPTVAQLGTILRGRRVLEPGALSAVSVYVVRVGPLTTPRRRSARGVGRELHIRDLLRSAIQQSGARVEIASEGLHLTSINHE